MRNFVKFVMISFLAAVAVGCGSSEDFVFANNNNGPANQGFQILLSQAELAAMFPPTVNQSIDPNIVNFHVFVFDAAGNQVGNTIVVPNNQSNLDVLITGLVIAHFDVVLAGVDANGNVVAAYEAEDIVVIPNDIKVIGSQVFNALDGFVLPDGQGGEKEFRKVNAQLAVEIVDGKYQLSWVGGPVQIVSVTPMDLVNPDYSDPSVLDRLSTELLAFQGTSGNPLTSPLILDPDQVIPGVTITPFPASSFAGFLGVEYQIAITRDVGNNVVEGDYEPTFILDPLE